MARESIWIGFLFFLFFISNEILRVCREKIYSRERERKIFNKLGKNLSIQSPPMMIGETRFAFSNVWILRKNKILLEGGFISLQVKRLYLFCFNKQDAKGPDHPVYMAKNPCFRSYTWVEDGWYGLVRVNSCPLGQGQMAKIECFVGFRSFPPTPLGIRLIEISTRRTSLNRSRPLCWPHGTADSGDVS